MKKNILIFPAGTEIGLEINSALKYSTLLNVFGATSEKIKGPFVILPTRWIVERTITWLGNYQLLSKDF